MALTKQAAHELQAKRAPQTLHDIPAECPAQIL